MSGVVMVQLGVLGSAMVLLLVASYIDVTRLIIPNWLNLALLVLGVAFAALTPGFPWIVSLAVGVAVFFVGALLFQFGLVGGGDVKLLAVLGFWSGIPHLFALSMIMAISGGILSLFYLLKAFFARKSPASKLSLAQSATLLHADMVQEGGVAVLNRARSNEMMKQPIPYGVAIAVGGLYVLISIASQLSSVHG